jgi:hypothetical protein
MIANDAGLANGLRSDLAPRAYYRMVKALGDLGDEAVPQRRPVPEREAEKPDREQFGAVPSITGLAPAAEVIVSGLAARHRDPAMVTSHAGSARTQPTACKVELGRRTGPSG